MPYPFPFLFPLLLNSPHLLLSSSFLPLPSYLTHLTPSFPPSLLPLPFTFIHPHTSDVRASPLFPSPPFLPSLTPIHFSSFSSTLSLCTTLFHLTLRPPASPPNIVTQPVCHFFSYSHPNQPHTCFFSHLHTCLSHT